MRAESPPGVNTPALLLQSPISGTKAVLTVPSAQTTLIKGQLVSSGEEGEKGLVAGAAAALLWLTQTELPPQVPARGGPPALLWVLGSFLGTYTSPTACRSGAFRSSPGMGRSWTR